MSPVAYYVVVWFLLIFAWATNFVIRIGFSALLPWVFVLGMAAGAMLPLRRWVHWPAAVRCG